MRVRSRFSSALGGRQLRTAQHQIAGFPLPQPLPVAQRLLGAGLLFLQPQLSLHQLRAGDLQFGAVVALIDPQQHVAGLKEVPLAEVGGNRHHLPRDLWNQLTFGARLDHPVGVQYHLKHARLQPGGLHIHHRRGGRSPAFRLGLMGANVIHCPPADAQHQ